MVSAAVRLDNPTPLDYVTPKFPSLYWPFTGHAGVASYLYSTGAIWRFTFLWTIIIYGACYLAASLYAVIMQPRNWRLIWLVPLVYIVIGGVEAMVAGSVVGGLLGAVYTEGYFKMSTWVPFVWALISVLIIILSSYAIQGGL